MAFGGFEKNLHERGIYNDEPDSNSEPRLKNPTR